MHLAAGRALARWAIPRGGRNTLSCLDAMPFRPGMPSIHTPCKVVPVQEPDLHPFPSSRHGSTCWTFNSLGWGSASDYMSGSRSWTGCPRHRVLSAALLLSRFNYRDWEPSSRETCRFLAQVGGSETAHKLTDDTCNLLILQVETF